MMFQLWMFVWMYTAAMVIGKETCVKYWTETFVVDYSVWRTWESAVIFIPKSTVCSHLQAAIISKSLSDQGGVSSSVHFTSDPQLPSSLFIPRHIIGAILLIHQYENHTEISSFLDMVSQKVLFNSYISWLFVTEDHNKENIINRLQHLNIRLDSDLIICLASSQSFKNKANTKELNNSYFRDDKNVSVSHIRYNNNQAYSTRKKNDVSRDTSRSIMSSMNQLNNSENLFVLSERPGSNLNFTLFEVYKIKANINSSLVVNDLGMWSHINGFKTVTYPTYIEQRTDFNGYPLTVGIRNITNTLPNVEVNAVRDTLNIGSIMFEEEDDSNSNDSLIQVLQFIAQFLNASYDLIPYSKLGWKNEEQVWMFLLGDVVRGILDLGLDDVTITAERAEDMYFSYPIVRSMKNVYFKRPDSGAMRDIFLAPFSTRLIFSVAGTGMILVLAVVIINIATEKYYEKKTEDQKKNWKIGEAIMWIISVLCMQGSSWSPKSSSGSMILIFSLCFALITYNAYAAFITSVLSVHVTSIKGLKDLLQNDFSFGYLLGGQDEIFLRTVNDTTLRQLYFRGLVQNHGVKDASVGLLQASKGKYAFFISSHVAHYVLEKVIPQEKRCDIQELPVADTKSVIALPMSWTSPYRKIINLSLLRMREGGVLSYIQDNILLPLPRCEIHSMFNSARLSDVYSAFLLLGIGTATGVIMAVVEVMWQRKLLILKCCETNKSSKDINTTCMKSKSGYIEWQN